MEDGLVHGDVAAYATGKASLNPCCNGRWSRTIFINRNTNDDCEVS